MIEQPPAIVATFIEERPLGPFSTLVVQIPFWEQDGVIVAGPPQEMVFSSITIWFIKQRLDSPYTNPWWNPPVYHWHHGEPIPYEEYLRQTVEPFGLPVDRQTPNTVFGA